MKLGRIFGIEITVHVSWLFVFALVTWSLAGDFGPFRHLQVDQSQRVTLGVFTALLFFASVLLHELAHSLVAQSRGLAVRGITLFIFGGVSQFEGEARTAPVSGWIAAVGPLTSLVLGGVFYGIAEAFGEKSALGTAFGYLGIANLALAAFNLIPAYPLDGGRVLQAILWRATGERDRAVRLSINVGRVFAWAFIVYGIGETLLLGFVSGGLWLTFIGWFLLQSEQAEGAQLALMQELGGHTAAEIAVATPSLPADATAQKAFDTMVSSGARSLPVLLEGRLLGIVAVENLVSLSPQDLSQTYVTSVMTRVEDVHGISAGADARDVLRMLADRPSVAVTNADGTLAGFVTQDGLLRWYMSRRALTRR